MGSWSVLVVVGLGVSGSGCKKKTVIPTRNADPMALIPEGATFLMHLDAAAALASPALREHQDKMEGSELAQPLAQLRGCKLGPEQMQRIALGADDAGHHLFVLRGKGIGDVERWRCLAKVSAAASTLWPSFHLSEEGGRTELHPASPGGKGLVVDDNTVVISDAFWWPKLLDRVAGRTKPAIETQLSHLYAHAPTKHQLWFRGKLPARSRAMLGRLAPASESGLESVSGGLALTQGLNLELDAVFASAKLAQTAKRELSGWLDKLRDSSPMFGLPKSVMRRAGLEARATLLRFRMELQAGEWSEFQRNLSRISAGSRNAPKIPDMYPRAPDGEQDWKDAEKRGAARD